MKKLVMKMNFGPEEWSTKEQVKKWNINMFNSPDCPDSLSGSWVGEQGVKFLENYILQECGEPKIRTSKQWRRVFVILTNGTNLPPWDKRLGFYSVDRRAKKTLINRYRKDYYKSRVWKEVREQKFDQVGRECEECDATDYLHIHHDQYKTIGREKMDDLQVLCRSCHKKKH